MSGAIMNKIWGAFGMDANEEEEEERVKIGLSLDDIEKDRISDYMAAFYSISFFLKEEEENNKENKLWGRRNNKVVAMPQPQQVKMVISQPTTFDQAEDICDLLKEKQSVIVNLEYVNKDVARRIIDVVSGAVHALDGHIQKVSNSIFLIAPYNYEITNEMAREEIKNKLSVSWLKNAGNN